MATAGLVLSGLGALAGTAATPAHGADIALADDRLSMRVDPKLARETPFYGAETARVGLESMLRMRTSRQGSDFAVEVGHYGAARTGDGPDAFDQRAGVRGRISNIQLAPAYGVASDISGGYRVGDLADVDSGTLETTFTLRATPVARLRTRTQIGWWGRRSTTDRSWEQGGHGRLGLSYDLAGFGSIGAFERLSVHGPRGHERRYETGFQLDFGPHTFSLSQRLETVGRAQVGPPATAAAYGWQVGPLGLALSADYTAESERAPASGFAGLAVSFGLAGPGPGALLDALR